MSFIISTASLLIKNPQHRNVANLTFYILERFPDCESTRELAQRNIQNRLISLLLEVIECRFSLCRIRLARPLQTEFVELLVARPSGLRVAASSTKYKIAQGRVNRLSRRHSRINVPAASFRLVF